MHVTGHGFFLLVCSCGLEPDKGAVCATFTVRVTAVCVCVDIGYGA